MRIILILTLPGCASGTLVVEDKLDTGMDTSTDTTDTDIDTGSTLVDPVVTLTAVQEGLDLYVDGGDYTGPALVSYGSATLPVTLPTTLALDPCGDTPLGVPLTLSASADGGSTWAEVEVPLDGTVAQYVAPLGDLGDAATAGLVAVCGTMGTFDHEFDADLASGVEYRFDLPPGASLSIEAGMTGNVLVNDEGSWAWTAPATRTYRLVFHYEVPADTEVDYLWTVEGGAR